MLPRLHIQLERWKYNKQYNLYVSNMGHVRNKSKQPVNPKVSSKGYMSIPLHGGPNTPTAILLHRLVMLTWCPTPSAQDLTVDHLDHNKRNNAVDNLEWVDFAENQRRARDDQASLMMNKDMGEIFTTGEIAVIGVSCIDKRGNKIQILNGDTEDKVIQLLQSLHISKGEAFTLARFKYYIQKICEGNINYKQSKKYCGLIMKAIYIRKKGATNA